VSPLKASEAGLGKGQTSIGGKGKWGGGRRENCPVGQMRLVSQKLGKNSGKNTNHPKVR